LNNESARTAYLVDSDDAGRQIKSNIIKAGVRENMVITLPGIESEEAVIEDYISIDAYIAAISEQLSRSGCSLKITATDLPRPNRPKRLEEWCKTNGVGVPSKRAIAYHVVEMKFDLPIVDEAATESVARLFGSITRALGID